MFSNTEIAKNLKALRLKLGHTTDIASKIVHVGPSTWSRWELEKLPIPKTAVHLYCLLNGEDYFSTVGATLEESGSTENNKVIDINKRREFTPENLKRILATDYPCRGDMNEPLEDQEPEDEELNKEKTEEDIQFAANCEYFIKKTELAFEMKNKFFNLGYKILGKVEGFLANELDHLTKDPEATDKDRLVISCLLAACNHEPKFCPEFNLRKIAIYLSKEEKEVLLNWLMF